MDSEKENTSMPDSTDNSATNDDVISTTNDSGSDQNEQKTYEYKKSDFKPKGEVSDERNVILRNYDKHYKTLLIIPSVVVVLAVLVLLFSYYNTGEFFQKDVSISGGVTVTLLQTYDDLNELEEFLEEAMGTTVNVRKLTQAGVYRGLILDAGLDNVEDVNRFIELIQEKTGTFSEQQYSVQFIGSSLGASFFRAVIVSIFTAFLFMAIVVFVYFRFATGRWIWLPSMFIVWTVLVDMLCTFAVISLLQIRISTAGLAAFLLLIGYSVDTDILLTMRTLKSRQEKIFDRIMTAAKTGIFMTLAGMAAITAGMIFTQSETIRQIMLILVIGLAFDLLHTWLTNAGVLRWYMERNLYDKQ